MKNTLRLVTAFVIVCLCITACKDDNNIFKPNRSNVSGHVYDENGNPLSSVTITGSLTDPSGVNSAFTSLTDNTGFYIIKNAPIGYFTVSARFGSIEVVKGVRATQDANELVVDFVILRDNTVTGIIKDNNGKPVKEANVAFERQDSTASINPSVKTDSEGHYNVFDLPYGIYKVHVDFAALEAKTLTYALNITTRLDSLNIELIGAPVISNLNQVNTQASIAVGDSIHFHINTVDEFSTAGNFGVNFIATVRTASGVYMRHYDFSQTDVIGEMRADFSIPAMDLPAGDYKVEFDVTDNDNNESPSQQAVFTIAL